MTMKKFWKTIGVIAVAIVIFAGGYTLGQRVKDNNIISAIPHKTLQMNSPAPTETPAPTMAAAIPEQGQPEKNIIEKNSATAVQDGWTLVNKAPITLNGNAATLVLYTSAAKDSDGTYIFDDSNNWVLEVQTDGEYYTLLNKRVQFGSINFVAGDNENGDGVITAVTNTNTGITVDKYTYNGTAFEGQTVYNSGVLNITGSTLE